MSTATTGATSGGTGTGTGESMGNGANTGTDRRRWIALAVVMTASFMDLVDATIVNVAIPSIQRDTGAGFSAVQWITAGYALAFAVGLITGGRLGDIYGRKRIFLTGTACFTVASLLCGLAAGPEMLVATRMLQGGAAALMVPQVLSIIHATFCGEERGKVFGMFGAVIGLAAVTGPLLGALLTQWDLFGLQWRPIFLINLPVGIAGLLLGRRFIDESKAPKALRLDLIGVALATAGLLLILYPLVQGRENGWPLWGHAMMAGGLAVLAGFVRYERAKKDRDGSPLVELSLFRARSFAAGVGVQLIFGVACGLFFLVWTLYMQAGLGWSPLHAGLTGLPFTIACSASAGMSVQLLVPRFGRRVLQGGALITAAGALIYIGMAVRYGQSVHSWQMALPLLVMGAGMGMVFSPLTDAVLSEVPREHAGSASGLINTTNQLGNAFGLALVSVAFTGSTAVHAFEHAMFWMVGALAVVVALMSALPRRGTPTVPPAESAQSPQSADSAPAPALVI